MYTRQIVLNLNSVPATVCTLYALPGTSSKNDFQLLAIRIPIIVRSNRRMIFTFRIPKTIVPILTGVPDI